MNKKKILSIPIYSTDHPYFKEIARMVDLPSTELEKGIQFYPAIDGFETGAEGSEKVDISFLSVPYHRDALNSFDKHPHNEELFVVLQGSFYMIVGSSEGGEMPLCEELHCFKIEEGTVFVQKRNVWHTACWPLHKDKPVRYLMILSGHRALDGQEVKLDHYVRELPDNMAVIPDFPEKNDWEVS